MSELILIGRKVVVLIRIIFVLVVERGLGTIIRRNDIVASKMDCMGTRNLEENFLAFTDDKVKCLLVVLPEVSGD